jgi:hypothetical protein
MSDPRCTFLFNNTICESCLKQIKLLSSTKGSTVSNLGVPVWLCFAHFHRRKTIKMTGALRHRKISAGCFFLLHNTTRSKEKACGGIYPIQSNTNYRRKLETLGSALSSSSSMQQGCCLRFCSVLAESRQVDLSLLMVLTSTTKQTSGIGTLDVPAVSYLKDGMSRWYIPIKSH